MDALTTKQGTSPGVIDTLSAGFANVNQIIWVALFPIVLDLFLWKGPQLSIASFAKRVLAEYSAIAMGQADGDVGVAAVDAQQGFEQLRQALEGIASEFNLFSVLAGNGPLLGMLPGVPSLAILKAAGQVTEVTHPLLILMLFVAFALLSVFLGCVYLGLVAQQVRDGKIDLLRLARSVWRYWLSAVAFAALMLGLAVFAGVPAGLFVTAGFFISPAVGLVLSSLVSVLLQLSAMLMILYFFFIGDAIVVSEVGPFRAVANSVRIVMRNFGSAMLLILLIFVISFGTLEIWRYLIREPWGSIAGIVGNAYILSGLTAARMLFYRNKLATITQGSTTTVRGRGDG